MGATHGVQSQSGFRGREDTVAESSDTTWFAPINTSWVAFALDTNFRVRFEIKLHSLTLGRDFPSGFFTLWYSHNGGSFTQVKHDSSVIKSVSSSVSGYNDDDDTTQLIGSNPPFKTANNQVNAGDSLTSSFTWLWVDGTIQYVETEWVLQLISADLNGGDTVELRIRKFGGAAFAGGYTYFPIITAGERRIFNTS